MQEAGERGKIVMNLQKPDGKDDSQSKIKSGFSGF